MVVKLILSFCILLSPVQILTEAAKGYVDGVMHNQKITSYNYKIGSNNNRQSIVTINMRNHTAIYDPIIDVQ